MPIFFLHECVSHPISVREKQWRYIDAIKLSRKELMDSMKLNDSKLYGDFAAKYPEDIEVLLSMFMCGSPG